MNSTLTVAILDRKQHLKVRELMLTRAELDRIVQANSAFATFDALVNAAGNYRPSIYLHGKPRTVQVELVLLSQAYDQHQARALDSRRVYRADWELVTELPTLAQIRAKHMLCGGHFFGRGSLKFFNQTMKSFKVVRDGTKVYVEARRTREYRWRYNPVTGALDVERNPKYTYTPPTDAQQEAYYSACEIRSNTQ